MIQKLLLLSLAGALGTLARYGMVGFVNRVAGVCLPWGTMAVNLAGCFAAGLLWALFENRWPVSGETRAIVLVGFLGAFTTFSTFVLESGELARAGAWMHAGLNVTLQNGLGFVALFAGIVLGRMM